MSLLMEALRKAEEAKRKGQDPSTKDQSAPEPEDSHAFSLVPFERDTSPHSPAQEPAPDPVATDQPDEATAEFAQSDEEAAEAPDELHSYLQDEPAGDEHTPAPRRRVRVEAGVRQSEGQLAAASIFAAKQQAAASKSRYLKPALLSLALLLPILGLGLWYLQQDSGGMMVNPELANFDLTGRSLDTPPPETGAPQQTVATATPEVSDPGDAAASATTTALSSETVEEPLAVIADSTSTAGDSVQQTAASAELAVRADGGTAPSANRPAAGLPEAPVADNLPSEPASPSPELEQPAVAERSDPPAAASRLQVSRSREEASVNSTLQSAWNTLQAGDMETAGLLYRNALAELPNNRDALLGMAVIHTRNNELDQARRLYAQALTLNPQDPLARTGLLQTMASANSSEVESELRSLLNTYPELAPVHFALGNLYAARQRWSDAQNAYFNALLHAGRSGNGPVSPDYAFNLAVSLEQLQQPAAALDYYRQAQTLSLQSAPGFDPALLRSRLAYLEQNLP